jgi:hypothetical protein
MKVRAIMNKLAAIILTVLLLVLFPFIPEHYAESKYNDGFEAGKAEAMRQIELSNGITNTDSSIAALKNYPNDSLNIAIFNLYATDEEREMVKQFAMWIKRIKEVR